MAEKSITIKINADTKNFLNELKKAEKQINATQKTADNLAKALNSIMTIVVRCKRRNNFRKRYNRQKRARRRYAID